MGTIDSITKARRQLKLELLALEEIRDLVRVQIHLGGMELKDAGHAIETQLFGARRHAEDELAKLGEAVGQDVRAAVSDVRCSIVEFGDRIAQPRR